MLIHSKELLMGGGGEIDLRKSKKRNLFGCSQQNYPSNVVYALDFWEIGRTVLMIYQIEGKVNYLQSGVLGRPGSTVQIRYKNSETYNGATPLGGWEDSDWKNVYDNTTLHPGLCVYDYAYENDHAGTSCDANALCFEVNPFKALPFSAMPNAGWGYSFLIPISETQAKDPDYSNKIFVRRPELDTFIDLT